MKIEKETSFMRDELVKEPEVDAVVSPTYKKAIDDFKNRKELIKKSLKSEENREDPILGKEEDKISLEESLFEDAVESTPINEAMIEIDDDDLLDMLSKELDGWKPEPDVKDLYMKMYENQVAEGVYNGGRFNAMEIVDNDWVNWTDVISEGDDYFDDCLKTYKEAGYYEVRVSDEDGDDRYIGYIEAVDNESDPKMFLIRLG